MVASDVYKRRALIVLALTVVLLVIDQWIKISVKTGMCLHESIKVTDWFYISFIENNGMAFGMTMINKLVLSIFRIVAIVALGWYLARQLRRRVRMLWLVCLTLVFAGRLATLLTVCFTD